MKVLEIVPYFLTGKGLGNYVHECEMLLMAALPESTGCHMSIITSELSQKFG